MWGFKIFELVVNILKSQTLRIKTRTQARMSFWLLWRSGNPQPGLAQAAGVWSEAAAARSFASPVEGTVSLDFHLRGCCPSVAQCFPFTDMAPESNQCLVLLTDRKVSQ